MARRTAILLYVVGVSLYLFGIGSAVADTPPPVPQGSHTTAPVAARGSLQAEVASLLAANRRQSQQISRLERHVADLESYQSLNTEQLRLWKEQCMDKYVVGVAVGAALPDGSRPLVMADHVNSMSAALWLPVNSCPASHLVASFPEWMPS